jgi:hypothetical protein
VSRLATITFALLTVTSRQALADDTATPAAPATENAAATAKPAESPTPEAERKDEPAAVFLHVASPATVRIERDDTGEVVCTSPCDKNVPATAHYHIGGHRPSPSFVLVPPSSGRADVRVKPGSKTTFWTGVGALGLSGLLIGGGVGTLVYGYSERAPVQGGDGTETDNTYTDFMIVGTSLLIVGVVAGIWGGATVIANASTSVRGNLNTGARVDTPARPQQSAGGLPRSTFVSILGGTF